MSAAKNALAITGGIAILSILGKSLAEKIASNIKVQAGQPILSSNPLSDGFLKTNVPITIENHNPFPIGVDSFRGIVSYGGLTLANVSLPVGLYVEAGGVERIVLNLDIPIQRVLTDTAQLINSGNIFDAFINKIMLNGYVKVLGNYTNTTIPLNNIPLPII